MIIARILYSIICVVATSATQIEQILRIGISTIFFFKQKTAYEMRISDWSSDVCSSDLPLAVGATYHDHQRVAPTARGLSERFTAFSAAFDDADDDDGDGRADPRLNPEYVVYELRGLAPDRKSTRLNSSH